MAQATGTTNIMDTLSTALHNEWEDYYPAVMVDKATADAVRRGSPSQQKALRRLLVAYWQHVGMGPRHWGSYEMKKLELRLDGYVLAADAPADATGRWSVTIEMGRKGDEGTLASLLCRRYGHFFLTRNGGFSFYSGRDSARGWRHLTSYLIMGDKAWKKGK